MSAHDLIADLDKLGDEFRVAIQPLSDEQSIRATQAQFLSRRAGALMKQLGKLPPADKPAVGQKANQVKQGIVDTVAKRLQELADAVSQVDLARAVDVTLPARPAAGGHLHLLTQVRLEAVEIFAELGFVVADGPRSRPTGTRSRRSRSRRITPRATCRTRSTCPTRSSCARTRARSRSARC